MSLESVRAFLAEKAPDLRIVETDASSATVALAAEAHGVAPRQIAKTLSVRLGDRVVLVVVAGDARLDNKKIKAAFGAKPRLLDAAEVAEITGHPVGGVCPFGLASPLTIYCDATLARSGRSRARRRRGQRGGPRRCGAPRPIWSARNGSTSARIVDASTGTTRSGAVFVLVCAQGE